MTQLDNTKPSDEAVLLEHLKDIMNYFAAHVHDAKQLFDKLQSNSEHHAAFEKDPNGIAKKLVNWDVPQTASLTLKHNEINLEGEIPVSSVVPPPTVEPSVPLPKTVNINLNVSITETKLVLAIPSHADLNSTPTTESA